MSDLLIQLGWVLTRIKAEVTEEQDRLLDACETQASSIKEEYITLKELVDLAESITLDHYGHVYIDQFEQIKVCFSLVVDDIKEQILQDRQQIIERLESVEDLTLEKGEKVIDDLINGPLYDFKGTLEAQFRL